MSAPEPVLKGGCQCGRVQYGSTALPSSFTNCHCQTCRRLSGASYLTFGEFPTTAIVWTSGESSLTKTSYSDIAERAHCSRCGSHIYMAYRFEPDVISITAGSIHLDSVKGRLPKLEGHIFCGESSLPWEQVPDDNLPRYSGFSADFQKMLDDWRAQQL